jgi:serine/threonine-protein kinase
MFCLTLLARLFPAKHLPTASEFFFLVSTLSFSFYVAGLYWLLYVALEPYVRRRWPQSLISWSRLLAGGFRDPLVGGQVLIGIAVGVAMDLGFVLHTLLRNHVGGSRPETYLLMLRQAIDTRHLAGGFVSGLMDAIQLPLFLFFLFFLLRVLLRRQWLAALAWILLLEGLNLLGSTHPLIDTLIVPFVALLLFTLIRFGLLPLIVVWFLLNAIGNTPITTDLSVWYAGGMILSLVSILALTAWAFHTARAGRPLFKEGFLEN